tara:strand:- start:1834 stop:2298 length:465 start_codon:yes stop_codon:yes gene_type:complete
MRTTQDFTHINFKNHENIIVPEGTLVAQQKDIHSEEKRVFFVNEFDWIEDKYPEISKILKHDAIHYGLIIPEEYINLDSTRVQSVTYPKQGLPSSEFSKLTLELNGKKAIYISGELTVNFLHDDGVQISAKVPSLWARTRVLQFMESLLQANLV